MRLRITCKCGGSFEVRGGSGRVHELWQHWQIRHNACLGVAGVRREDDGTLVVRRRDEDES